LSIRSSVVDNTVRLLRHDTVNPPGNEAAVARLLGGQLEGAGFRVREHQLAPNRLSLIATIDGKGDAPICFTGHLDTVPLGETPWTRDPWQAEISEGKLYGRGSSDMKGGIAAIVEAATILARLPDRPALMLVFTASEETGCQGAIALTQSDLLQHASAIIVAEPTSNYPYIGHRGALWLKATFQGRTAHGSMPHLGINAVKHAADAIVALNHLALGDATHETLGTTSLNIGYCRGGQNINSVPDTAEIGLDIRTTPPNDHADMRKSICSHLPHSPHVECLMDLQGFFTPPDDPWVQRTFRAVEDVCGGAAITPKGAPYITDGSVLKPALGNPPTIVIGPGSLEQAHKTDEFCEIERLEEAVELFVRIASPFAVRRGAR
jgi:succinyl-diaminopimelate desuccinylase